MALALFDLDNTLLSGDSDYEWGQFLVSKKLVDAHAYELANQIFYEQYKQGTLDIHEFSAFSFTFLSRHSLEQLEQLRREFMQQKIIPLISEKARKLVTAHKEKGDTTIIITATNSFITQPIASAFGVDHLIATEPRRVNGKYTTEIEGIPCFQEGKLKRMHEWLELNNENMDNSTFYSDSYNDLPLLEYVTIPVAVNPDEKLAQLSTQRNWKIISLRD